MTSGKPTRVLELDGLRGCASLSVLLFHCIVEMYGRLWPELHNFWSAALLDGGVAVSVFFLLSGDALASAFFTTGTPAPIDRLLVKRYFRLTVPILASCLLVFLIRVLGFDYHVIAAQLVDRSDWLGSFLAFEPTVFNLLRYALLDVYTSHRATTSYNPMLWTMAVEMIGSMLVFLTCYLWPRLRHPRVIVLGIATFLFACASSYSLFFLGLLIAEARSNGMLAALRMKRSFRTSALATAVLSFVTLGLLRSHALPQHFYFLCAMSLVWACHLLSPLRNFLRSKPLVLLGAISFPLYLTHFAVLISLTSWLTIYVFDARDTLSKTVIMLLVAVSVVASLVVAMLFRLFERIALRYCDRIATLSLRGKESKSEAA